MSNRFTLTRSPEELFPWTVTAGGLEYTVNADFRTLLKIFRMFNDPLISNYRKPALACKWFYVGEPPPGAFHLFRQWLDTNTKDDDEEEPERQYDFEADAEEIYASFLSQYRIDLLTVDRLHWRQFLILFNALDSETAFRRKLRLRFLNLEGIKDDDGSLRRAKEAVQLTPIVSRDELIEERRFAREWGGE